MAVRLVDEKVVYYMDAKIPVKKVTHCAHCNKDHAEMSSAHYPGLFFCSLSCLWKHDAIGKKAIRSLGINRSIT